MKGTALIQRIATLAGLASLPLLLALLVFVGYVVAGVYAGAHPATGTLAGLGVAAPVSIARDARGIPHIRAKNAHDAYFAEGYAQATDRLFQLDLLRRLVTGRLCEVFGSQALSNDENARTVDVDAIAQAQLDALPASARANLQAFADGVNAAMRTRPLPPEFRVLAYHPDPWAPKDTLVASFATVLALTDSWTDVAHRDAVRRELGSVSADAFFSITDPQYDAPVAGTGHAPVAALPPLRVLYPNAPTLYTATLTRDASAHTGLGSNEFAAGAALTATHRALLASDPHLELRIPGVWWLADLAAPGLHVAGATLAGVPGIVLGHNAHVAWGATNGEIANVSVYREQFQSATSDAYRAGGLWLHATHRSETFNVRFGSPVTVDYLRTRHGFVFADLGTTKLAAAWTADLVRQSTFPQFDALTHATSVRAALAALSTYATPAQNFALADDGGNAGYVLAGEIPTDPNTGLFAHDGPSSPAAPFAPVPYAQLPHLAPGRSTLVFTANARPYGAGYPYRLTAAFAPPYRAAEIQNDLRAHRPYDVDAFSAIQADVLSLPERDLARIVVAAYDRAHPAADADTGTAIAALRAFDGRFVPESRGAVFATLVRRAATERIVRYHMTPATGIGYLQTNEGAAFVAVMRAFRERPRGWVPGDDYDAFALAALHDALVALRKTGAFEQTWADFGQRTARHPLASLGLSMWNGARFPGRGDPYSPHVQGVSNAQSYRAVWDVGNWEAGGMVIPQGESGEPGSPHYRDAAPGWVAGTLVPLPFDDAAVSAATVESLTLLP